MNQDQFVNMLAETQCKEDVDECIKIDGGAEKTINDEEVYVDVTRGATIEKDALFFTACEYKKTFNARPPTAVSFPAISMPKDDGTAGEEKLFIFAPDSSDAMPQNLGPHKKGKIFVTKIIKSVTTHLPKTKHKFLRQGTRVINNFIKKSHWDSFRASKIRTVSEELKRCRQKHADREGIDVAASDPEPDFPPLQDATVNENHLEDGHHESDPDDLPETASQVRPAASAGGSRSSGDTPRPMISLSDLQRFETTAENLAAMDEDSQQQDSTQHQTLQGVSPFRLSPRCSEKGGFSDDDQSGDEIAVDEDADEMSTKVARAIFNAKCSKAIDSKKIGNQKRRLNDLLETLMKDPDTNTSLIADITTHKALVQLSEESAIKMLPGLANETFLANMRKLLEAKVKMSSDYKAAVFTKFINHMLLSKSLESSFLDKVLTQLELHKGWGSDFDPTNPTLASLDYTSAQKFKLFQKYVMERVFIPLLAKGAEGASVANAVSAKLVDSFENMSEDIELSETSSAIVMDCITIWRCIIAVCNPGLDGTLTVEEMETYAAAVRAVFEAAQVAGSRNIKAMVGRILQTSPYWQALVQAFLDTRAAWKDLRPKVHTTVEALTVADPGAHATNEVLSRASDLHLLATEKLRNSAYESLTKRLLSVTSAHVAAVISAASGSDRQGKLKTVSEALQSVSLALPQEPEITTLTDSLAAELQKSDEEHKVALLITVVEQIIVLKTPSEWDEASHDLCKALDSCQGAPGSQVPKLCKCAYEHATTSLAKQFDAHHNFGSDGTRMIAESLTNFLSGTPLVKTLLEFFGQVRNMYSLMKQKKALVKENDKETYSFVGTQTQISLEDFQTFQAYLTKSKGHLAKTKEATNEIPPEMKSLFDLCSSKITECEQISTAAILMYRTQRQTALEQTCNEISLHAGGAANGAYWAENLESDPEWESFEAECKQTILSNEYLGSQLPSIRKKLLKDRAI